MNGKTEQRIAMMFNNTLRIICFAVLSVIFDKWWIMFFAGLFYLRGRR